MLELKQEQELQQKLSPQQIQYIKLLQLNTLDLDQRIKEELEENPLLEEGLDETEYSEAVSAGTGTRADRAYLPGRMEHDVKTEYEREGIPVPERIRGQLADLAREHGVDEGVVAPVAPE